MPRSSPALMIAGLESMLADSPTWRTKVGAADAASAKAKILFGEKGLEADLQLGMTLADQRPFAIVGLAQHGYTQIGQGEGIDLGAMGAAYLIFSDKPTTPANHKISYLAFVDSIGLCIEDIAALPGHGDYFPFTGIHLLYDPHRPNLAARTSDDFWIAAYLFTFSVVGGEG